MIGWVLLAVLGLASPAWSAPVLVYQSIVDTPDPVPADADLVYQIVVANSAVGVNDEATNVEVELDLPTGLTYLSFGGDATSCTGTDPVTCSLGTIQESSDKTFTVVTRTGALANGTALTTDFDLTSTEIGTPVETSRTTTVQTYLAFTVLTDAPDPVTAGEQLTYTVTVANVRTGSPDNMNGVVLRLPDTTHLTYDGDTLPGTCSPSGGAIVCSLGNLADNGDTFAGTITYDVSPSAPDGATIAQDFDLYANDQPAPGVDGDLATDVDTEADLAVTLSAPPAVPGTNFVYTLEVENLGPSDAQGVEVDLTPDANLPAPTSVSGEGCAALPCTLGSALAAGDTATVTVTYALAQDYHLTYGLANIESSASASTTTTDPVSTNDTEDESTPIEPQSDLVVSVTSTGTTVTPGEPVLYTVTVQNDGPSAIDRVRLLANPSGLLSPVFAADEGIFSATNQPGANWTGLDLDDGESAQLFFGAWVDPAYVDPVVALPDELLAQVQAEVVSPYTDPGPGANLATHSDEVYRVADLAITKDNGLAGVAPNLAVPYAIVVRNLGPSDVKAASVDDTFDNLRVASASWVCSTSRPLTELEVLTDLVTGGLGGARRGAVSSDGEHLYVAAETDNGVAVFDRDTATGELSLLEFEDDAATLDGTSAVVVSPDGEHVYATSRDDDAVVYFTRDTVTGLLTRDGAVQSATDLDGAADLAIAPDGRHVYAVATTAKKLVVLARNATTGVLTQLPLLTIVDTTGTPLDGVAAVTVTPDGRHVVVASAGEDSLLSFTRDLATGELAIADVETSATNLDGAGALAVSPDGGFVYVTGALGDSLAVYARDPASGLLTFKELERDGVGLVEGMDQPRGVVVSPDGKAVYVAGEGADDTVVIFTRETAGAGQGNVSWLATQASTDPYGLAMSPGGEHLHVLSRLGNTLTRFAETAGAVCSGDSGLVLDESVDLPANSSVLFTATAVVAPGASGTLDNTATVTAPADVDSDPVGTPDPLCTDAPASATNNSCSDRDPIVLLADLVTTKTTAATFAVPGGQIVYTVEVVNNGPNLVNDVDVFDDLTNATDIASATWTCLPANDASCGAPNGSGDIDHEVDLPPTGKVTYTVTVTLTTAAAGVACTPPTTGFCLVNSAAATLPTGYIDPSPSNATVTIETPLARQADLSIVKEVTTVGDIDAGSALGFRITVRNCGPSDVTGATVQDTFPSSYLGPGGVGDPTWTCSATNGSCPAGGTGAINAAVNLDAGALGTCAGAGEAVFLVSGQVDLSAEGVLSNTAVVAVPAGGTTVDPTGGNNASTASVVLNDAADLVIVKDDGNVQVFAGEPIEYTIAVFNNGPENAPGARVTDFFDPAIQNATWTCSSESPPLGTLRKIEEEIDLLPPNGPLYFLGGVRAIAVAPNGEFLYAVGSTDNGLSSFARDASSGELEFVEAEADGVDGVTGLAGATDVAVSPDGEHVYVASSVAGEVVAFDTSPITGELTLLPGGPYTLAGALGVAVSPDGEHVYAAGGDKVAIFERESLGSLNLLGTLEDGVGPVDGLAGAAAVAVSPDGEHVYVASQTENAVALFRRDTDDQSLDFGMLTFVEELVDGQIQGSLTLDRLAGARDVVVTADGKFVYVAAGTDDAVSIFRRNTESGDATNFGKLTYLGERHQGDAGSGGAAVGLDGARDLAVTADGEHLYAAGEDSSAIAVFARNRVTGSLKFLESLADGATVNCLPIPQTCVLASAGGAAGVAASPDGLHVYLSGGADGALVAFERDGALPSFAFIGGQPTDRNGPPFDPPIPVRDGFELPGLVPPYVVDGLAGASAVASYDNQHVFATGLADQSLVSFLSDPANGQLTFVERKRDGVSAVDGLEAPTALAVYANSVYVVSSSVTAAENALAFFSHDAAGLLTQHQIKRQGGIDAGGTIDGLFGASSVVVSPDGQNVYVASRYPGAIAVFARDGAGFLTFKEVKQTGVGGVSNLGGAHGIAISTDGAHVYAAASVDDAVVVFARDTSANPATFGRLTQIQVQPNLGGLDRAIGIAVSREVDAFGSRNVYVAGHTSDALVVFRRNVDDSSDDFGKLTRSQMLVDEVDGVQGLNGARGVAVSSDGKQVYVAGEDDDALAIFSREEVGGTLTFVEARIDGAAGVDGIDQAYAVAVVREGRQIYVAGLGDNAIAAFARSSASRCTGAGVGDIDDTIDIAAFGQVVYTVKATVDPAATGTLVNLATVEAVGLEDPSDGPGPEGRHETGLCNGNDNDAGTNPDPTNDTCTDIDIIAQRADLEVTKTDGTDIAIPGEELTYTLTVFNRGPSNIVGATVEDDLSSIFPGGATWTCVAAPSGALSFVGAVGEGDTVQNVEVPPSDVVVAGLDGATGVAFSPDGEHVYATGLASDAIVVFAIDPATGALRLVETVADGAPGVDGLDGAGAIAISPDGAHVYVTGQIDDAVVAFERNETPGPDFGKLALLQILQHAANPNPIPGAVPLAGLDEPAGLALSADGESLYVAAANSSALVVLDRNADELDLGNFGLLGYVESEIDGVGPVDGLAGASAVAVSADGAHVYATGENDDAVAVFERDAVDGSLDFVERKVDGAGAEGMSGPRALAISADGANVYVAGTGENAIAVFARDAAFGTLTFLQAVRDGVGGFDGLAGVSGLVVTPDDFHVYATGTAEDALVALRREITDGGRLELVDVRRNGSSGVGRLFGPTGVASSPDGRWILAAARLGDAVNVFSRPTDSSCNSGSGLMLNDVVNIAAGSRIVYTITGVVAADACPPPYPCTGTDLVNVATVDLPAGAVDPDPSDNEDTDTDDLSARVDLSITKSDGNRTVRGLAGATSVAVSPQGDHLYATGGLGDGVAMFARDPGNGDLAYLGSRLDNTAGVDGLNGASWVALSPNGRHVYVTGAADNALAAFARDLATGELTFLEHEHDGAGGVSGMLAASGVAVSADGRHVYVAGRGSSAIAIFAREADDTSADFGRVAFVGEVADGLDGVEGLGAVRALVLSSLGEHLYAVGESDNAVAVFARDAETGELTFLEAEQDLLDGVTGLAGPRGLTLSPDGRHLYVASFGSGAVVTFARDDDSGSETFGELAFVGSIADGDGGADGLAGARGVFVAPDPLGADPGGQHVYVAGANDDAIAVFERDDTTGVLTYVGVARNGEGGVESLDQPVALAMSPDAAHVYAAAASSDGIAVLTRDWDGAAGTGELTFREAEVEGSGTVAPGSPITYEILVVNNGPSSVIGARVQDIFPGELENVTFTCQTTGGSTCFGGSGDLDQAVNLPVGSTVLFLASGTLKPGITGTVVNTATVTTPSGVIELDPSDNSATDDDTVLSPVADLVVEKIACTDGDPVEDCEGSATTELVPGTEVFFRVEVRNEGPSDAKGVHVTDVLPEILTDASWTCAAEPIPGLLSTLATHVDGAPVGPTPPRCPLAPPPTPLTALDGLEGARAVALASDGRNVYVGGGLDDGIAVFHRDLRDGSLKFVGTIGDGDVAYDATCQATGTVDGLDGLSDLASSPDGLHVYATGEVDDALVVFARDGLAGDLVFRQILRDGVGANGLGNALALAISPDGKHVYTAAFSDNGVGVFVRNAGTGNLVFDSIKVDGGAQGPLTIDGLAGASDVAVAPSGAHVYAVGATDGGVAVFARDAATGKLTYLEAEKDGVGDVDGLAGASGVALDPDGAHVYAVGAADGGIAVFARDAGTGLLSFLEAHFDGQDGVDGLAGAAKVEVSPDGEHVYVAGEGESAIAIFARDPSTGRLQFLEAAFDGAPGLDGLAGVAALALPADGEQVYAAGAAENALAVLRRQPGSRCTPAGFGDVDDVADIAATTLAATGRVVYTIRALLSPSAVGTLVNTATATPPESVADPDPTYNSATVTIDLTPEVTLTVTKDDGLDDAVPGTEVVYTITITNLGPSDLVGASVIDEFPAELLDPVWACSASGVLEFVEMEQQGIDGVGGLDGGYSIASNPDPDGPEGPLAGGTDVYVASRQSSAVAHFTRDALTGELEFVTSYADGDAGIDGLGGTGSLAVSPDGKNVYATGSLDHSIVVFDRDATDGSLTFREMRSESEPDVDGLEGAFGVAVSPDGEHVYVTGEVDDTLVVFARDPASGALTFVEREKDGFGGLELGILDGVTALAVTPDGRHVIVVGPVHDKLVVFARDPSTGAVDFVGAVQDGILGVDGLDTVQGLVVSPSGQFVYAAGLADDAIAIFERDAVTGELGYLTKVPNGVAGVTGLDGVRALELAPDGQFLYAAGYNSDAVSIFARDGVTGLLTHLETLVDGVDLVDGLDGARALTASADGRHLYAVGEYDDAVAVFQRFGLGTCAASGAGDLADTANLAVGGRVVYTATATVDPCALGSVMNTVSVVMPPLTTNLGDESASDTDNLTPYADLSISKTNGVDEVVAGTTVVYSVQVDNAGPSCAFAALVVDDLPADLSGVTWTCEASAGASCLAAGSGDISEPVVVEPGATVLFAILGTLDPAAAGTLVNTATVTPEAGVTDVDLGNNSATDSDPIIHVADLAIDKLVDPTTVETLAPLTFTITVTNQGPSVADDVTVTDFLPPGLVVTSAAGTGWSCAFDATTVTCTAAVLAPGVAPAIVVEATAPATPGSAINTATVSATSADPVFANDTALAPFTVVAVLAPTVVRIDTVPDHGDGAVTSMETLQLEVTGLVAEFSEGVEDPVGDSDPQDVTNPENYQLFAAGYDGDFSTGSCGAAAGDDVRVPFASVVYDPFTDEATLSLPAGERLAESLYQLLVCATIRDLSGNPLDGDDDGTPGDDFAHYFRVQTENRLARPYWDFASDLGAWSTDGSGTREVDVTAPDASGFFLSQGLSVRGPVGSAVILVSQCLPIVPGVDGEVAEGRARLISAAGNPLARIDFNFHDALACGGTTLASAQSPAITGDTGGNWASMSRILPDPPVGSMSLRVTLRAQDAASQPFEVQFDDLELYPPIFADGFETGDTIDWNLTQGGAP